MGLQEMRLALKQVEHTKEQMTKDILNGFDSHVNRAYFDLFKSADLEDEYESFGVELKDFINQGVEKLQARAKRKLNAVNDVATSRASS